ncbi:MAG TPA: hypothetical protein VM578_04705 [Candidatus Saccharimonadales bacterium]|nr:hypothetical protein [Candidatus Saccharimonadales bacterium]
MALKKKPEEKVKGKQPGKDVPARVKASSTKVQAKKTAAKKAGAGKIEVAVGSGKHSKKRVVVAEDAGQGDAGEANQQDPFEIARQTMKGSVPAIVEAMVELAKQGSCSHAKTLLEMTGAKYMFEDEAESRDMGEPWAKLVLERLDEAESSQELENSVRDASSAEMMEP